MRIRTVSLRAALPCLVAALAVGCASGPPPSAPGTTPPKGVADQRAAAPAALAGERQWLQSWFRDTPVKIEQANNDGPISIEVPRAFCFDAGSSAVKPALAAVLDKVAESLRRLPSARLVLLAAPDDAGGASPLAQARAARLQEVLRAKGVAPARIAKGSTTAAPAVQLRLAVAGP